MGQPPSFRRAAGVITLLLAFAPPAAADLAVGEQLAVPVGPTAAVLQPSLGLAASFGLFRAGDLSADLVSRWHWFGTKAPVGALVGSFEAQGCWSLPMAEGLRVGLEAGAGVFAACRTDLALPGAAAASSAEVFGVWEGGPGFAVRLSLGWQAYWGLTQAVVLGARYELGGGE